MKIKEIRSIAQKDVNKRLSELRLELMKETGNVKRGRAIKNPGKIMNIKKDIARLLTVKKQSGGEKK